MTSKKKKKSFLKKSNVIQQKIGDLFIEAHLTTSKNFPKTCTALSKVANAETRDDVSKKKGFNDYSLSLEKLLSAFDTFIREYTKNRHSAGFRRNYDFSDPCELTIYLLWQIRHTMVHQGGVIDKQCKKEYEEKLKVAKNNNITPIISLPEKIEIGDEFSIDYENYVTIKNCFFKYFKKRISQEDMNILHKRGCITNIRFSGYAVISIGNDIMQINIEEAEKVGCKIDYELGKITYPSRFIYYPKDEKIIFTGSGESINTKKVREEDKKNIIKSYKGSILDNNTNNI